MKGREKMEASYRNKDGKLVFVYPLRYGSVIRYGTVVKRVGCGVIPLEDDMLPLRCTKTEAEADLVRYAEKNGWAETGEYKGEERSIKIIRWENGDLGCSIGTYEEAEEEARKKGEENGTKHVAVV